MTNHIISHVSGTRSLHAFEYDPRVTAFNLWLISKAGSVLLLVHRLVFKGWHDNMSGTEVGEAED